MVGCLVIGVTDDAGRSFYRDAPPHPRSIQIASIAGAFFSFFGEYAVAKYRDHLPQLSGHLFLTDGGIETSLIYLQGFDLPYFAAFDLLKDDRGLAALRAYFEPYARIAREQQLGIVLESPTWRASTDWADKLGYSEEQLADIRRRSVDLLVDLRREYETPTSPVVISGCLGPRGDGYSPTNRMGAHEAAAYHAPEIRGFAATDADLVTAITMNYPEEAIGIARAAQDEGMPVVVSFTVETDGRLPTGDTLQEAIEAVDAQTGSAPAYYMVNCAHPTHFAGVLAGGADWTHRIRGLRANASRKSHAELDISTTLDAGNPDELAGEYRDIRARLRNLNVVGGCCGTDHRHIERIALVCSVGNRTFATA
jgi:S-methylmethionine-dependent homocysteine/selenocysteine methylase